MTKVIISIPAYNEADSISNVIKEIKEIMEKESWKYTIHVVDDGSSDSTASLAKKAGAKVFSRKRNKGLASTFQEEIKYALDAKADVIVHTDADGQYPAKFIPSLIKKVESGFDLVLGSRFLEGRKHISFSKNFGNRAFARVFSRLCKIKLTDTTTGFRAFTKEIAKEITFTNTFTYTQEQLIRASKAKFKISEVPIEARKTRDSRLFGNVFEYAFKAWVNIFRIYRDYDPLKFFGRIGLSLVAVGLLLGLWLVYLFLTTGKVGHLPATILTVLLLVSGIQFIVFGFLADMNKK
jgi:glycosyltransferase involved in cell wall biosynthesis